MQILKYIPYKSFYNDHVDWEKKTTTNRKKYNINYK